MVGLTGATVSMVTLSAADAALVLPATSVAVALRLCATLCGAAVVTLQAPALLSLTLPSRLAPLKTLTVALASAVPVSVRVLSLVMPSPATLLSVEYDAMVGLAGATVSMVTLRADDAALVLPATSVAVALRLWAPLARAPVV